ncbi:non-ribosomal peptide synthetase [Aliikangiella coralliicola]|uniref:Amino acid adenylation domain-containing protein n=1 Tax=Aliikangiella coralliicola TaxID=2592383 RepID=A0A545UCB4_9GAMM|nr:non-ribosomal peptide synthetase [Aliikangiella coralliicola]TQV87108.1 amino acid adenylation domain-containing protein [Aliikangiella coralliicola]
MSKPSLPKPGLSKSGLSKPSLPKISNYQFLSAAQLGIWSGQRLNLKSSVYNAAECIEIIGPLDVDTFVEAVREVAKQADTLHCRFVQTDNVPRLFVDEKRDVVVEVIDISEQSMPRDYVQQLSQQDLATVVDLEEGPLYREVLLVAGPRHFFWYQRAHHIALDGYAFSMLARNVSEHYQLLSGKGKSLNAERAVYFSPIERALNEDKDYRASDKFVRDKTFWQSYLSDMPTPVSLAKSNNAAMTNVIKRHTGELSVSFLDKLKKLASQKNLAWPDILIASFAAYLARAQRCEEVVLGLPVMNRLGSATIKIPAMVMNIIPLRVAVDGEQSIIDIANNVAGQIRLGRKHHRYRYEDMRRDSNLIGGGKKLFGPVINVMPFDYQLNFGDCESRAHNISAGPVEDLSIGIYARADGNALRVDFDANPELYGDLSLQQHYSSWISCLQQWLQEPAAFCKNILIDAELGNLEAHLISGAELAAPTRSIVADIFKWVETEPDTIALIDGDNNLTYQSLWQNAQQIAVRLTRNGVTEGDNVAIYMPRGKFGIVAILGCLLAGACFVPVDPNGPKQRAMHILNDISVKAVLSSGEHLSCESIADYPVLSVEDELLTPVECSPLNINLDSNAYIMYTSGTTGQPKGVQTSHGALAHFARSAASYYQVSKNDRMLQFAPLTFDALIEEVFVTLVSGAALVLRNDRMLQSFEEMLSGCQYHQVTLMDLPTAYWHEMALSLCQNEPAENQLPTSLRGIIIGGEAALPERVSSWCERFPDVDLWNTYGPTETTVVATAAKLSGGNLNQQVEKAMKSVSIGLPLPGYHALILDEKGYPVPKGVEGELFISGPALSSGYINRAEETAKRFVEIKHWDSPVKAYRTGDKVCLVQCKNDSQLTTSEQLFYLGRVDDEFKISGHRVSPVEIENVILTFSGIEQAAVIGHVLQGGVRRLVAHLVVAQGAELTSQENGFAALKQHLGQFLASAVIPSEYLLVDKLPKNSSGKIDRKQLHADYLAQAERFDFTALSSEEKAVIQCWQEILGRQSIQLQDDFFILGGQSLQTIQVASRLSSALSLDISVADIFEYPTASELAGFISAKLTNAELTSEEDLVEMVW